MGWLAVVVVLLLAGHTRCSESDCRQYTATVTEVASVSGSALASIYSPGEIDCTIECIKHQECAKAAFSKTSNTCQLLSSQVQYETGDGTHLIQYTQVGSMPPVPPSPCDSYTDSGGTVFVYCYYTGPNDITRASQACVTEGGVLAFIDSESKQTFITNHLLNSGLGTVHINCVFNPSGDWKTLDGSRVCSYTNWADGEPKHFSAAGLTADDGYEKWLDFPYLSSHAYLCQTVLEGTG